MWGLELHCGLYKRMDIFGLQQALLLSHSKLVSAMHCPRIIHLALLLFPSLCGFASAQPALRSGVTQIASAEDVIRLWTPERHVFVKGNIGVGNAQLLTLQDWIQANAPHWTVVLMDSASNERFQAPDGRDYRDLDAVEYALGYGLSNRTGFGKLENPQTHERDGAVFVLFLKERKFSYFASDAQDRRGLGEANWVGQLDQPAFRAMRSGGRIVDAAKDTIESIDSRLKTAIRAESDARQRAEQERARAVQKIRQNIAELRQRIEDVQFAAANFRREHPVATGTLASPPLPTWDTELNAIETEVTPDSARQLAQRLSSVSDDIERHLNGYAAAQEYQ